MTQKLAKIFSLGICILFLTSLFVWPKPVSAGLSTWSAENIPSTTGNMLGPAGVDIRDFAIAYDSLTIYAVPGDSIADNLTFKSTDGGLTWATLTVPIRADLVAIAPDSNLVVIANNTTPEVRVSLDNGVTWSPTGFIQESPGVQTAISINDLAISPLENNSHYIVVAGKEAGYLANLWYLAIESILPAWHGTRTFSGFATDNETAALTFSPSFTNDATILAATDNTGTNAGVRVQILNIDSKLWNNAAGFADFPYTIINNTGINRLSSASLALDPGYASNAPNTFKLFVGLTVDGDVSANATSGIYRLTDYLPIVQRDIILDTEIHSLAFDGSILMAGSYNTTTVYRITNPYAKLPSSPRISSSENTKSPGGNDKTLVAWLGGNIVAGTSGDESAFAEANDSSIIFNDISLIDTAISKAKDVAVSKDGKKIYLVSENGTDTSVWSFDTTWRRVLNPRNKTNFIIRIAPSNANIIYLAETGTINLYYNNAGGTTPWHLYISAIGIHDMSVESSQVIYVLSATGAVSKGTKNGLLWGNTNPTGLNNGATIVSANTNIVFAGSQDGYIAYTYDGGVSWTKIPQAVQSGAVQVIADQNFAANKIIYAATDMHHGNIKKWCIGTSTTWLDIFNVDIPDGVYGLAIISNVLYALADTPHQSTLWRLLSPTEAEEESIAWTSSSTNITTDPTDPFVELNAVPQALKASKDKLWAVKTNDTNRLYSYTDVIIDAKATLLTPTQGYLVPVYDKTGLAYDEIFSWQRPSMATGFELVIAEDVNFNRIITTIPVRPTDTLNPVIHVIVGPKQVGAAHVIFTPAHYYYWKVRVIEPSYSLYSEIWNFTIEPIRAAVPPIINPIQGEITSITNINLSWLPLVETTEYRFVLDDNLPMDSPIVDTLLDKTSITLNVTLQYGVTYFWLVRSTKPVLSDWSDVGIFIIVKENPDSPPVVIEKATTETATLTITAPPATEYGVSSSTIFSTPVFITIAVLIMVILIAVTIFFINHQRPIIITIPTTRKKPPITPYEKTRLPGVATVRPEAAEEITSHPTLIEQNKEGEAVIADAKSFTGMATEEAKTDKVRQSQGKKLTAKIHDLAKKENLYVKYPNDVTMLLSIWAEYGSKNETSNYLTKTFEFNPYNAIKLLKIYLPAAQPDKEPPTAEDFTIVQYNTLAKVIDPENIYVALTKVFKFKAQTTEEKVPVLPADRNLADQFIRLHTKIKGQAPDK